MVLNADATYFDLEILSVGLMNQLVSTHSGRQLLPVLFDGLPFKPTH